MANDLSGYQRQYLKGLAHGMKPIVTVGDAGVTEGVVQAIAEALLTHELIKVRMRKPESKKDMAQELADKSGSALCGIVGHTAILYLEHPEKPVIHVPQRSK